MDLKKYLALFLSESRERLQAMEKNLGTLERDPGQQSGAIDEFFRSAHSIKGMAASMGYQATTALSHALEDLMEPLRTGAQPVTRGTVDLMLAGVDRLRELVDAIDRGEGKETAEAASLVTRIREHLSSAPLPVVTGSFKALPDPA